MGNALFGAGTGMFARTSLRDERGEFVITLREGNEIETYPVHAIQEGKCRGKNNKSPKIRIKNLQAADAPVRSCEIGYN